MTNDDDDGVNGGEDDDNGGGGGGKLKTENDGVNGERCVWLANGDNETTP